MRWLVLPALVTALSAPAYGQQQTPDNPPSSDEEFQGPARFDVGARLGYGRRLDDPPFYEADRRDGLVVGAELLLFAVRRIALGVAYEHYGLGSEESGLRPTGTVELSRSLDTLWVEARLYPLLREQGGIYLGLAVGPSWQGAEMTGSVWPAHDPGAWESFRCTGRDTPGFALRSEVGGDLKIAGGLRAYAALGVDGYRLSDELLDDCVPGAGSATVFGLRAGLAYAIDLL